MSPNTTSVIQKQNLIHFTLLIENCVTITYMTQVHNIHYTVDYSFDLFFHQKNIADTIVVGQVNKLENATVTTGLGYCDSDTL